MKLMIGHWYENREAVVVDERAPPAEVPLAGEASARALRDPRLHAGMRKYWTAPELWPGRRRCASAGGPSLTPAQVEACRDRTRCERLEGARDRGQRRLFARAVGGRPLLLRRQVVAVAPKKLGRLEGRHRAAGRRRARLRRPAHQGAAQHRAGTACARARRPAHRPNSGYQAINLAVHLGAKRILLLGYDMHAPLVGRRREDALVRRPPGRHEPGRLRHIMLPHFESLPPARWKAGVEVINCTPGSALQVFPRSAIEEALRQGAGVKAPGSRFARPHYRQRGLRGGLKACGYHVLSGSCRRRRRAGRRAGDLEPLQRPRAGTADTLGGAGRHGARGRERLLRPRRRGPAVLRDRAPRPQRQRHVGGRRRRALGAARHRAQAPGARAASTSWWRRTGTSA
jgi:hypothetical protein